MSRRGWAIWLGPPIALIAIALAVSRFQAGAAAGGPAPLAPAGACPGSPIANEPVRPALVADQGTWWTMSGTLDANGALVGRQLALGRGGAPSLAMDLPPDAMASGPTSGIVALTSDDGRHSQIRLVATDKGCSFLVHEGAEVARGAIVDPRDGSILVHRIDRDSRADLGTWRYSSDGMGDPTLVAPGLEPDPQRGPNWVTDLRLGPDGSLLAVQSCTDAGCLTRIFDLQEGSVPVARFEGSQGPLIGLTATTALTWEACVGFPCAIQSWDLGTGVAATIVASAESAAVSANGRFLVAVTDSTRNGFVRLDLEAQDVTGIRGINRNERLVVGGVLGVSGIEVRPDEVGLVADNAMPRPFSPAGAEVLP